MQPILTIYTAIFGAIGDQLRQPVKQPAGVQLVAFVDPDKVDQDGGAWSLRGSAFLEPDPRRRSRRHKCLSHVLFTDSEYTLWLDGSMELRVDALELAEQFLGECSLCTFEHRWRDCIYDELAACLHEQKDAPEIMGRQIQRYQTEGFPAHYGLCETGVLLRRNDRLMQGFNEAWWQELAQGSVRDQLSFNYLCWKRSLAYATFDGLVSDNSYVRYYGHRPEPPPTPPLAERQREPPPQRRTLSVYRNRRYRSR